MLKLLLSALVLVVVGCSHKSNPVQVQQRPEGTYAVSIVVGIFDSVFVTTDLQTYTFIRKDSTFFVKPKCDSCGCMLDAVGWGKNGLHVDDAIEVFSDTTWRL